MPQYIPSAFMMRGSSCTVQDAAHKCRFPTCLLVQDLTQAARTLARQVQEGLIDAAEVDEHLLASRLSTSFVTQTVGPVE
jgi:hypothetical protein